MNQAVNYNMNLLGFEYDVGFCEEANANSINSKDGWREITIGKCSARLSEFLVAALMKTGGTVGRCLGA